MAPYTTFSAFELAVRSSPGPPGDVFPLEPSLAQAGDWASLRVDGEPFDGILVASVARYVPWAEQAAIWASAAAALTPKTGVLVVGEILEEDAKRPGVVDGAHRAGPEKGDFHVPAT